MKRIYKIMRDKKGEGYIDAAVVVFCVMFVIALGVRIFPVLSRRYSLTTLQTSWCGRQRSAAGLEVRQPQGREPWRKNRDTSSRKLVWDRKNPVE